MKNFDETRRALVMADWRREDRTYALLHDERWHCPGDPDYKFFSYGSACRKMGLKPAGSPARFDPVNKTQRPKLIQAKHLKDRVILNVIRGCAESRGQSKNWEHSTEVWVFIWDVFENFPDTPEKVIMAKLVSLQRRELIDGCLCGCRGDIVIRPKGYDLIRNMHRIQCRLAYPES